MTAALEGGEWSAARPRQHFTSGKDPVPILQEAGWAPRPVWTGEENLAPTWIRSRTVQPVAQSLYRLSYPVHKGIINLTKYLLTNRDIPNNKTEIALFQRVFSHYYFCYGEQYSQTSKGVAIDAPTCSVTLEIFLQYYLTANNVTLIGRVLVVY